MCRGSKERVQALQGGKFSGFIMIKIEKYYHHAHYALAETLLALRDLPTRFIYDLPENGYIAFSQGQCVAMGFLRIIEGDYALFDAYITNPACLPIDRDEALDLITDALKLRAEDLKLKKVFAFTVNENIVERAISHGFSESEFRLIGMNISKEDSICRF